MVATMSMSQVSTKYNTLDRIVTDLVRKITIGEPEFVERMQRTYHDQAVANKVTIVHSCGFDSVCLLLSLLIVLEIGH